MNGGKGALQLDGKSQVSLQGQGEVRTLPQEPVLGGELGYALAEFLLVVESSRRGGPVEVAELFGFLA